MIERQKTWNKEELETLNDDGVFPTGVKSKQGIRSNLMNRVAAITLRHWKSLLILNVLVVGAVAGKFMTSPKEWTASAQLVLPEKSGNLDANLGPLGSLRSGEPSFSTEVNPLKVQRSILTSDAVMEEVRASDPERSEFIRLIKYKKLFEIEPNEQSTILSVSVNGSTPKLALQRAIALIEAYQDRLNELRRSNKNARKQFNQKELERAKENMIQAQRELAEFQESSGLINSEEQTKTILSTIAELSSARSQALAEAQASQNRVRALSSRLELTPATANEALDLSGNPQYQALRNTLAEVEAQLAQAQSIYKTQHPQIQALLEQRSQLQRELQQYVTQAGAVTQMDTTEANGNQGRSSLLEQLIVAESEAAAEQTRAEQLQEQIAQLNARLNDIPANQAQLVELQQQYDVAQGVYKGLVAQVQQNTIDAFSVYPNVQVLDPPTVDLKPTSPRRSIAAINAFLASLFGSVALVLFLEGRNPLLNPNDLQGSRFPVVVSIPRLRHSHVRLPLSQDTEMEFQRLASAISLQSLADRRLLITSAIVGEGKTTITLGLAAALADLGFRVLLVDGDFRRAELSGFLGYTQAPMATNQPIEIQSRLDLLPTFPQEGKIGKWVRQGRFEQSLADAQSANDYDYILVDSAPVSLTSETALMSAVVPNVLFVVRPGLSKRNSVNDSLDQLAQHNARILGLVVNGVEMPSKSSLYRANRSLANT